MVCKIGLAIFTIVEAMAFAFFIIGTLLAMFRFTAGGSDGNSPCVKLWGYKTKCSDSKYDIKVNDIFDGTSCENRKKEFQASEALSIISIVVFGACIVMALLMCCCFCVSCICRIVLMILIVVGMFSGAATFACMACIYNNRNTEDEAKMFVQKLVTDERADAKSEGATKESNPAAALLSGTASGSCHLTSGSFPMFADGDDTPPPPTSEPVVDISGICDALKDSFMYGSGFILIVAGWALHTVNIVFAILPC